jgi:hypothetical protein
VVATRSRCCRTRRNIDFVNTLARADHPAQTSPTVLEEFVLGEAPFDAQITELTIIPTEDCLGTDLDHRTFELINKGQDGQGDVEIAEICMGPEDGFWTAMVEMVAELSADVEHHKVKQGDILAVRESISGAGQGHPDLQVSVKGTRL